MVILEINAVKTIFPLTLKVFKVYKIPMKEKKEEEHKDQGDGTSKVYCAELKPPGQGHRCLRAEDRGRGWITFRTLPKESMQTCMIYTEHKFPLAQEVHGSRVRFITLTSSVSCSDIVRKANLELSLLI